MQNITQENRKKEQQLIEQLCQQLDNNQSSLFLAGAGSGKTYALIQCLKYLTENYRDRFLQQNQKIACITFTNVAANHVREQIGISDVIEVSTIHTFLWNIIGNQRSAMIKIHKGKIEAEICQMETDIKSNPDFTEYRKLSNEQKEEFCRIMSNFKKEYWKIRNLPATQFKKQLPEEIQTSFNRSLWKNAAKFKKFVETQYRLKRFKTCLEKIEQKADKYTTVRYESRFNTDRLDRMRISHDTVLEYASRIIENYPQMRQIVIDRFPFILIDEYQDTAVIVSKIMRNLDEYSKRICHNFATGYFGDPVQNIYGNGVGEQLTECHPGLNSITKVFNRRSYEEIIAVANKIRKDSVKQQSIYEDCHGGKIELYYGTEGQEQAFIEFCKQSLGITKDNALHCMLATNELVAIASGFSNVFSVFKDADAYKGTGYMQLTTELVNHDVGNLGVVQSSLYRMLQLYTDIRDQNQSLTKILPIEDQRNLSFSNLRNMVHCMQAIDGSNLNELLYNLLKALFESISFKNSYQMILYNIFDIDPENDFNDAESAYDAITSQWVKALYPDWNYDEDTDESARNKINNLLDLEVQELIRWYHFVNQTESNEIHFHTIHSTKGLEYENVALILGEGFGRDKEYFKRFFVNYGEDGIAANSGNQTLISARNLLYVAVTRTRKNLFILYTGSIDEVKDNMEKIFGEMHEFSCKQIETL